MAKKGRKVGTKMSRSKRRKKARSMIGAGGLHHRPIDVLKHFEERKGKELKELSALIKRRGG